jgi:chromosome segregation ATPase
MSEEEKTLSAIDETIKAAETNFRDFINVLETSRTELIKLENDKKELSQSKETLEKEKIQLESEKSSLEAEKKQLELEKVKLEEETGKLEIEKQERDQKIGDLTGEQMKLLDEYKNVKVELQKFMTAAEEAEHAEFNFERVRALLSIYTVLVSEIWQGQPHYRILKILHGDKEWMSRDEIKNTTGISGAFVLRAVQELAKVELVEYDMDTSKVKLIKRLFPKKALEEKK